MLNIICFLGWIHNFRWKRYPTSLVLKLNPMSWSTQGLMLLKPWFFLMVLGGINFDAQVWWPIRERPKGRLWLFQCPCRGLMIFLPKSTGNPLEMGFIHLFWDISSGFPMFECFILWEISGNRCLTLFGGSRIAHPMCEADSFMSLFWRWRMGNLLQRWDWWEKAG